MSKVKIELINWDYKCADGCCTDYGTKIIVNGVEAENSYEGGSVYQSLEFTLKQLGFDVEINESHE